MTHQFKIGQRVKTRDQETGQFEYGVVVDTTRDTVIIKWDDLHDPCEHPEYEFERIKIVMQNYR